MKILFTICGRQGSEGVKNKNTKMFLGYPLPYYTVSIIDLFIKHNTYDSCDILLNTDSYKLIDMLKNNIKLPIIIRNRNKELAKKDVPKILVVKDSYKYMIDEYIKYYDRIVDLDITSPLRTLDDLVNIIEKSTNNKADITFSVVQSRRNPYFNMVENKDNDYKLVINSDYTSRQQLPQIYDMNGSMYVYLPQYLETTNKFFKGKCDIYEMEETAVLDIDKPNDFKFMEVIASYLYKNNDDYRAIRDNITNIAIL